MPDSQNKVLFRFRRYQRLLMFGGGLLASLMILLTFAAETHVTIRKHFEAVGQVFDSDRNLVLSEMDAREDAFRDAMVGAELIWRDERACDPAYANQYWQDGELLLQPSSAFLPQWVFGADSDSPADGETLRFLCLAVQWGRTARVDATAYRGDYPAYLYSLQHDIAGVIPAPPAAERRLLKAGRDLYIGALKQGVDRHLLLAGMGQNSEQPPLYWIAPKINPMTGKPSLRIAGAIMDGGSPFAALVMEYEPESLVEPLKEGLAGKGAYLVLSPAGEIIASTRRDSDPQEQGNAAWLWDVAHIPGLNRVERYQGGDFVVAQKLGATGWILVYAHPWSDIWAAVGMQIGASAMMVVTTLALIWFLLIYFKIKVFRPLLESSRRVFESERLGRVLIETAPVGLGLIAVDTCQPLLRSPAMTELANRMVAGAPTLEEELVRRHKQRLARGDTFWRRGAFHEDLSVQAHDGSVVDLSVSSVRVRYQGRVVLMTAFSDVTAKKRLEHQLREAKQAADSANVAKSAFLAAISHEIRTPLHAILGNLELLERSPLSAAQRDRLSTIKKSSDGLLAIVSDVLDFSKIEAGELTLEETEFDVQEVAARALTMFAPLARSKNLRLSGELGVAVRQPMKGDSTRLGQVINNLLANAIKFTESGKVILRLAADELARRVRLEVEDAGIGMTPEYVSDLFRAFSQADATINRRYGGTGLGLALCSRLARAMGGTLTASSEQGKGSLFVLDLPMGECETSGDVPKFDGEAVLLVAAQESSQAYVGGVLRSWGLKAAAYRHPAQIDQNALDKAAALIIWGERHTWRADDENPLLEDASWVVDCGVEGPSELAIAGRMLSASVYGLKGLATALRYALEGKPPERKDKAHTLLAHRLRVLVVEDNVANRHLLQEQLTLLGCGASLAEDGEQALSRLEREGFDVMLTDLSLPGMDGYELARRALERRPAMPIMAITAHVTPETQVRCLATGMTAVLHKPLLLKDLEQALSLGVGFPRPARSAPEAKGLLAERDLPDDMKETFRMSCKASLLAIRQAMQEADVGGLCRQLHILAGTLGVFRMHDTARHCAEIESALLQAGLPASADHIEMLCRQVSTIVLQGTPHSDGLDEMADAIAE